MKRNPKCQENMTTTEPELQQRLESCYAEVKAMIAKTNHESNSLGWQHRSLTQCRGDEWDRERLGKIMDIVNAKSKKNNEIEAWTWLRDYMDTNRDQQGRYTNFGKMTDEVERHYIKAIISELYEIAAVLARWLKMTGQEERIIGKYPG